MTLHERGDIAAVGRGFTHHQPGTSLPALRSLTQRLVGESMQEATPRGAAPSRFGIDRGKDFVGKRNHDLGHKSSIASMANDLIGFPSPGRVERPAWGARRRSRLVQAGCPFGARGDDREKRDASTRTCRSRSPDRGGG